MVVQVFVLGVPVLAFAVASVRVRCPLGLLGVLRMKPLRQGIWPGTDRRPACDGFASQVHAGVV